MDPSTSEERRGSEVAELARSTRPELSSHLSERLIGIDVYDVRVPLEGEVPNVLQETSPGEHLSRVPHEVLQQGELLRRQPDGLVTSAYDLRGRVQVVGADVQPLDSIAHAVTGREHQHGRPPAGPRMRRPTSKPSRSGSMTSSTSAS